MRLRSLELVGGILFGVFFFFAAFGSASLDVSNISWLNFGDQAQTLLGWIYFANEPWQYPLGKLSGYVHPIGSSLAYTDTYPWFAIFVKALTGETLSGVTQITGFWMLLNYVLLGLFSSLLLSSLGVRGWSNFLGMMLFVSNPLVLQRFDIAHATLTAHWLLVAALWLACSTRNIRLPVLVGAWMALCVFATATHPYIAAMVIPCSLVSLGVVLKRKSRGNISVVANISLLVALTAGCVFISLFVLGHFETKGMGGEGGFRYFSSDVLGFFNPQDRSMLFDGRMKSNQYEGFAWLGLGLVMLVATHCIVTWRRKKEALPQLSSIMSHAFSRPFLIVCLLMFVFSWSSNVRFFGSWLIDLRFVYKYVPFLTESFRSCGRFVWPLYYLVIAFAVVAAVQLYRPKVTVSLLCGAILLQLVDQFPFYFEARGDRNISYQTSLPEGDWANMLTNDIEHVVLLPPRLDFTDCLGFVFSEAADRWEYAAFAIWAAKHNLTINSAPRAKPPVKEYRKICDQWQERMTTGVFPEKTLYFIDKQLLNRFPQLQQAMHCEVMSERAVCVNRQSS